MEITAIEVDQFMMDGEMVSKYIASKKNTRKNPSLICEEAEATLSVHPHE